MAVNTKSSPTGEAEGGLSAKISKIASLATRLSQVANIKQDSPDDVRDQQLYRLLDGYLRSGRDDVLNAAIDLAREQGGEAAAELIQSRLEQYAEIDVFEDEDGGDLAFTLMLVPIATRPEPGQARTNGTLAAGKTLTSFTKSFQKHGLVRKEAGVFVVPYVYETSELASLRYSQVNSLRGAVARLAAGQAVLPERLAQTGWPAPKYDEDGDPVPQQLYFMVGVRDDADFAPFSQPGTTEEERSRYFEQRDAWHRTATSLMGELLDISPRMLTIASPALFFKGVRLGCEMSRSLELFIVTRSCIMRSEGGASDVRAVVTAHGEGERLVEYRVTYSDIRTGQYYGDVVFPALPWNRLEVALEAELVETLEYFKLGEIIRPGEKLDMLVNVFESVADGSPGVDSKEPEVASTPEWFGHTLH